MTTTDSPQPDRVDFALTILEWLESQSASAESVDAAFRLLADRRRRLTLDVLYTHDDTLTLADLAEEVTSRQTGKRISETDPETVAEVYISLYHDHVPRLVDAGLVAYDQEGDLVAPTS